MVNSLQPYDLGYTFYPPRYSRAPGHPRLDVVIREMPTELHFDPERVELPVVARDGSLEILTVVHPWTGVKTQRASAGRILIMDRLGKAARAFSFGGDIDIHSIDQQTICVIQSVAPILSLTIERSIEVILADEVEILLAQRRAAWANQEDQYEQKLAAVDPVTLYHACLNSLRARFKSLPASGDGATQKFIHFILVESRAMEEVQHLPAQADTLEELI